MENIIAFFVLSILLGGAVVYLIRAKRNGVKCVGCPAGGSCSNCYKKEETDGVGDCEENHHYLGNALCVLCTKCDRPPE